jgi:FtsP/CotA-like multicopper oxidase with cupredoxin domain
VSYLLRPQ